MVALDITLHQGFLTHFCAVGSFESLAKTTEPFL